MASGPSQDWSGLIMALSWEWVPFSYFFVCRLILNFIIGIVSVEWRDSVMFLWRLFVHYFFVSQQVECQFPCEFCSFILIQATRNLPNTFHSSGGAPRCGHRISGCLTDVLHSWFRVPLLLSSWGSCPKLGPLCRTSSCGLFSGCQIVLYFAQRSCDGCSDLTWTPPMWGVGLHSSFSLVQFSVQAWESGVGDFTSRGLRTNDIKFLG